MTTQEAQQELEPFELDDSDWVVVNKLIGSKLAKQPTTDSPDPVVSSDPYRSRFMVVAWLCGASYRQIAKLYGITAPTVVGHVSKFIPEQDRMTKRIRMSASLEELSAIKDTFYSNVDEFGFGNIEETAIRVFTTTRFDQ